MTHTGENRENGRFQMLSAGGVSLRVYTRDPGTSGVPLVICNGLGQSVEILYPLMQELPDRFPVGAMWHPSFLTDDTDASPHLTVDEIGELWIGIGTADEVQSIEMHQRYFDAAASHDNITLRIFDGADHGYTWPVSPNYHEEAATVGWAETTARFERILG